MYTCAQYLKMASNAAGSRCGALKELGSCLVKVMKTVSVHRPVC